MQDLSIISKARLESAAAICIFALSFKAYDRL